MLQAPAPTPAVQLTLFGGPDPIAEAIKTLDINALSPLEALNKLYELQKMANYEVLDWTDFPQSVQSNWLPALRCVLPRS